MAIVMLMHVLRNLTYYVDSESDTTVCVDKRNGA